MRSSRLLIINNRLRILQDRSTLFGTRILVLTHWCISDNLNTGNNAVDLCNFEF